MNLTIILTLLLAGLFLVLMETVVPGGLAGFFGALCLLCSLTGIFSCYGLEVGCASALGMLIAGGVGIYAWFRFLPGTRIGKGLLVGENSKGYVSYSPENAGLCGRTGRALTVLRPVGRALIDGRKYDVVSSGEMLESGCPIIVIQVEGNRIVVEKCPVEEEKGAVS